MSAPSPILAGAVLVGATVGAGCTAAADPPDPFCDAARPFAARSGRDAGAAPSDADFHRLVDSAPDDLAAPVGRLHDLVHLDRRSAADQDELEALLADVGQAIEQRCGVQLPGVTNPAGGGR